MKLSYIPIDSPFLASKLKLFLASLEPPAVLAALGKQDILLRRNVSLFCSNQCPGEIILKSSDLMNSIAIHNPVISGGFHTSVERNCLRILLREKVNVILCPARSIEAYRIPPEWKIPLEEGRMLLLSPFSSNQKRMNKELATKRNDFVLSLADTVWILHAAPGSQTMQLAEKAFAQGKAVYTIESEYNEGLMKMGAKGIGMG